MGQGERCTRIMTHEYIGAGTDGSSNEAFIDRRYKESADWILSGYRTITASVFSISRSFTKGKESNWISPEEFTLWKRISGMVMYGVFFFFFFFFFFLVFVFFFKLSLRWKARRQRILADGYFWGEFWGWLGLELTRDERRLKISVSSLESLDSKLWIRI